jgi:hypothetical protein
MSEFMKIALVKNINNNLVNTGAIQWPNEKVAHEACCAVASNLNDEAVLSGPLSQEDVAEIAHELQKVAAYLTEDNEHNRFRLTKTAYTPEFEMPSYATLPMEELPSALAPSFSNALALAPPPPEGLPPGPPPPEGLPPGPPPHRGLPPGSSRKAVPSGSSYKATPQGEPYSARFTHNIPPTEHIPPTGHIPLTDIPPQNLPPKRVKKVKRVKVEVIPPKKNTATTTSKEHALYNAGLGPYESKWRKAAPYAAAAAALMAAAYGGKKLYDYYKSKEDENAEDMEQKEAAEDTIWVIKEVAPHKPTPETKFPFSDIKNWAKYHWETTTPFKRGVASTLAAEAALYGGKKLYDTYKDYKAYERDRLHDEFRKEQILKEVTASLTFLDGLQHKVAGLIPSKEAIIATAGLAEAGPPGFELMSQILMDPHIKTAADADEVISQVLNQQVEADALPSPELVDAIETAMVDDEDADEDGEEIPPKAMEMPKQAYYRRWLKRAAEGSLTDSEGNSLADAAAHGDPVAQLELQNRPLGAYEMPQGKTRFRAPEQGATEQAVDDEAEDEELKAAELAYQAEFNKVARQFGPTLPAMMPQSEKIAHIQFLMSLPPSERAARHVELLSGRY